MKQQQENEPQIGLEQGQGQQDEERHPQQQYKNHLQEYYSLLGEDKKLRMPSLLEELNANFIQYNPEEDHDQFYLHLLHHSTNYKTLTVKVILGPFSTVINILNDAETSFLHELNCLYGSFGNVYLLEMGEQQIAIKCIQIKKEDRVEDIMLRAIKEYVINKIASAIKVGPKIIKMQEFDIIIYQNCFEFCMEKCFLSEEYILLHEDFELLKAKLRMLHQLKIVHCDIKPTNIVYSRSFKCPVFLDFGFSKILSSSPGALTRTKYVGSLETCCKQMVDLYLTKQFGNIDLFYNDAFSLKVSLKMQPIRQTGNDLQDILKYCDHSSSLHLSKIYYSLYYDKIFNATSEFIKSQHKNKRIKIMHYLDTLAPTQNLREFYFQFLYAEWGQSIEFHELARNFNHSHRHHLQLGMRNCCEAKDEEKTTFYLHFLQKILNCKMSLFKLDNELINYSEVRINYSDFMGSKLSQEDSYDFFISHVGNLTQNYYLKEKNLQLAEHICDTFAARIAPSNEKKVLSTKQKITACFSFLLNYCLEQPINQWKVKAFSRSLAELMFLSKTEPNCLQEYLMRVIDLKCNIQKKIKLLVSFYKAYLYQRAVWGHTFTKNDQRLPRLIEKIENNYYRLQTENKSFQKVLKLDLFLVKILLGNNNKMDFIEVVQNYLQKLKREDREARFQIISFLRIIYLYEHQFFEECRVSIEGTFNTTEIPIIIKPTYLLLSTVYYHLKNTTKCRQLLRVIEANLMTKDILYENVNILIALSSTDDKNTQIIESFVKNVFQRDYSLLVLILHRYFACKHIITPQLLSSFYSRIFSITKDCILVECLRRLSSSIIMEDQIILYERLIAYYKGIQAKCDKEEGEKVKANFIDKLTLDMYWLKEQYELIIETLDKGGKVLKPGFSLLQNDPQLFDYAVRAYLMVNNGEKVKPLIKCLSEKYHSTKPARFIECWIETISFILLFQYMLERGWQKFREFLLAVIDYIDIHPVKANVNCYVQCLRYTFSQNIRLAQIDNGLSTILFPMYQWKYPLLSFFHIEALCKMANLDNYLNRKELKTIMWRAASFVPFLRNSEAKWFLQEYYALALTMSNNSRYNRYILLKCRSLMNYVGMVGKNRNYRLKHLKLVNNSNLMDIILQKKNRLEECIVEQKETKMSKFKVFGSFFNHCRHKLQKYHQYSGNESIRRILGQYRVLMKLQVQ